MVNGCEEVANLLISNVEIHTKFNNDFVKYYYKFAKSINIHIFT